MAQGIEEQFTDIKNRLGETVCAFEVFRVLNEMCDKDVDPELNKKIQKHGMFWQAVLVGQHTVYIMGIGALLDARSDVASLYSVLKLLRKKIPAEVFRDINERLTRIGGRYLIYRHKIFGHNDLYRRDVIAQFNAEGFTVEIIRADIEDLEYVLKVLIEIHHGRALPTFDQAKAMYFTYWFTSSEAVEQTKKLLNSLI